jgi:hypothetical protein
MDPKTQQTDLLLDYYLAESVRNYIEKNYYQRINTQSALDNLVYDDAFMTDVRDHIALFSDHGVIHVRNVAQLIIKTLDAMHGVHIAPRSAFRFIMMKGFGVICAYFHDIGMIHFSTFGRASHSQFAAQEIYTRNLEKHLDTIWEQNCGGLAWRITQLHETGHLQGNPRTILRECLALVPAHSKSTFPIEELNDNHQLRQHVLEILQYDLFYLYQRKQLHTLTAQLKTLEDKKEIRITTKKMNELKKSLSSLEPKKYSEKTKKTLTKLYGDNIDSAFAWLLSNDPFVLEFIDDIKDTLRALRCADAFRQRGTSFKTSGGYQIFVNQYTGNSVFALSNKQQQMFLLENNDAHAVGEANIKSCEYTAAGDLSIAFYTGFFHSIEACNNSVKHVAMIICDIIGDVVDSLRLPKDYRGKEQIKKRDPLKIFLENTPDNWHYTQLIAGEIKKTKPELKHRIKYRTPLHHIPLIEKQRYLNGKMLDWSLPQKRKLIQQVSKKGFKVDNVKLSHAFNDVRLIHLLAGEILLEADSPPGFVYIPLSPGLLEMPLGGYASFKIPAYSIIGSNSVLSGTTRSASILAKGATQILMLPQEIYLSFWHAAYAPSELIDTLKTLYPTQKNTQK